LTIRTQITRIGAAKIEPRYQVLRDGELLVTADLVLAMIDRAGRVQRTPAEWHCSP